MANGNDDDSFAQGYLKQKAPPVMDEAAFHGVAGQLVRIIDPHTESDPVAVLTQFLAMFGNAAGRHRYRIADGTKHFMNVNVALVGDTAKARKGTSSVHARAPFISAAPDWEARHITSGLSSGEGLIWAVRDPIERTEPIKEGKKYKGESQTYVTDPGVADKRLLVIEPEMASVLTRASRDGNTLSTTIRQAWDSGDLRILTKSDPATAIGAHISMIAHVTISELLRTLTSTEAANGFANRYLWFYVHRSKSLPFGGALPASALGTVTRMVADAILWAETPDEFQFHDAARAKWVHVYPALSAGRPGLLGAILARAEAQTLRLACIYAALDCSLVIEVAHLDAALALWDFAEASAEFIFGDALGDPDADGILSALRATPSGLSRTDIRDLFHHNLSAARIERALLSLLRANLARPDKRPSVGGRPAEFWIAGVKTETAKTGGGL